MRNAVKLMCKRFNVKATRGKYNEGTLAQYAGRIHRESEGKTQVTIHDYVDCALPVLQRMFKKREKSYKAMGYALEWTVSV